MEILITASIGIFYSTTDKQHYLHVITAEEQNHYYLKISSAEAKEMSKKDGIRIEKIQESFVTK